MALEQVIANKSCPSVDTEIFSIDTEAKPVGVHFRGLQLDYKRLEQRIIALGPGQVKIALSGGAFQAVGRFNRASVTINPVTATWSPHVEIRFSKPIRLEGYDTSIVIVAMFREANLLYFLRSRAVYFNYPELAELAGSLPNGFRWQRTKQRKKLAWHQKTTWQEQIMGHRRKLR